MIVVNSCRVCGSVLSQPIYDSVAPGITSLTTLLHVPTRVYACLSCGHSQSEDLPDVTRFYDTDYRISLDSDEHDQLYAMVNGRPLFRTDRQAELVLESIDVSAGARVLDYGAAKAATLRKILDRRPDVSGYVFDVSKDYVSHWQSWLPADRYATYSLPNAWSQSFDIVTAHFVLEHVASPVEMLRSIHSVLKPGGKLFLSVPDFVGNPGDLLVVDHLNHFSGSSLERAFLKAGFGDIRIDREAFAGALVVTARAKVGGHGGPETPVDIVPVLDIAAFWLRSGTVLDRAAAAYAGMRSAIYGAGFYGSFIAARIGKTANLACFVDRNPHLHGKMHFDLPVFLPAELPADVEIVYAGLNPLTARGILAAIPEWSDRSVRKIFMDERA
jgi:SAM-dependent methyltransferase